MSGINATGTNPARVLVEPVGHEVFIEGGQPVNADNRGRGSLARRGLPQGAGRQRYALKGAKKGGQPAPVRGIFLQRATCQAGHLATERDRLAQFMRLAGFQKLVRLHRTGSQHKGSRPGGNQRHLQVLMGGRSRGGKTGDSGADNNDIVTITFHLALRNLRRLRRPRRRGRGSD